MFKSLSLLLGVAIISIPASAVAGPGGTTLTGTKTASTTLTETDTYSWELSKTKQYPEQTTWVIPEGQNATLGFTVTATRSGPQKSFQNTLIAGQVCLNNTGSNPTQGLYLVDQLEKETSPGVWTVVAGPIVLPVSAEIAAGASNCWNYSFDYAIGPEATYRNHAIATIDNWVGSVGTPTNLDVMIALTVTNVLVNVDISPTLTDTFSCPAGFNCTPSWTTQTPNVDGANVYAYTVLLDNVSVACGQTLTANNTADLAATTPLQKVVSSSIYTGTCHIIRHP